MEKPEIFWRTDSGPPQGNEHAAFRGTWQMAEAAEVTFRFLGASWFVVWLDGVRLADGPARFARAHPEYQEHQVQLSAGRHVLAVHVNGYHYETRLLADIEPFLHARVLLDGKELPVTWKCGGLPGFWSIVHRVNPQLGPVEWCDTCRLPEWQSPSFDDEAWSSPAAVDRGLGEFRSLSSGPVREEELVPALMAEGSIVEMFGYERDNPAARFFLRDLENNLLPAQGRWRRYDLGRVRLMRPRFRLDLPAGAVVEFAYAECLHVGRVAPWITFSCGDSCNLDHYIARGGPQEFSPCSPRGGRFLEVHIMAPGAQIRFLEEKIVDRGYYGAAQGAFRSGDAVLDRIWSVGVETHRACAEDALTDNPTRERGQWAGDVVTVGMDIAACVFNDLRLCRRSLVQCAQSVREDGLVAGLCPGGPAYLSTYAAQWITACLHYWRLSGDFELLREMFNSAERNIEAFEAKCSEEGLADDLGWAFVDWGYVRNPGPSDMALNLHYLAALRDMAAWSGLLGRGDRVTHFQTRAAKFQTLIARYFAGEFSTGGDAWRRIGYHRGVLGLRLGFFNPEQERACITFIKSHMMNCFPNDPAAPRLSDPGANNPQLITPYFAHYAMPVLIERGEMDFVLGQYRKCWGWVLGEGLTTWPEVFDTRWSHCHQWAGCPTWQLSRYGLGLHPRFDLGPGHYDFLLRPGSLPEATGQVPLPERAESIEVSWKRTDGKIRYVLKTPIPITLHFDDGQTRQVNSALALEFDRP